ncbi:MAG: hypothetical protein JXB13_15245, partial [Phycisphaerae bacterium]|nr:hypothetical protein [Phycisphaerae bacterium]
MRTRLVSLLLLMSAPLAAAQPEAAAPCPVLALAPKDASVLLYHCAPTDILNPVVTATGHRRDGALVRPIADLFTGPIMLAIVGTPMTSTQMRVEFAARISVPPDEFFRRLDEDVLGAIREMDPGSATCGVRKADALWIIRVPGPMPIGLLTGVKGNILYASTRKADVDAWLAGETLPDRLIGSEPYERLLRRPEAHPDAFVLVEYLPFHPFVEPFLSENERARLILRLSLDRLKHIALALYGRSADTLRIRFAMSFDDPPGSPPSMANSLSTKPESTALVPPGYMVLVRGAFTNGSDQFEVLADWINTIDPEIVEEYREEAKEFRKEMGFDFQADFLGNLVGEGLVALSIDAKGGIPGWMFVVGIAKTDAFTEHVEAVKRKFGLSFEQEDCEGVTIQRPAPGTGPAFAMATIDGFLVVANDTAAVKAALSARRSGRALVREPDVASLLGKLPAQSARLACVDLAGLCRTFSPRKEDFGEEHALVSAFFDHLGATQLKAVYTQSANNEIMSMDLLLGNAGGPAPYATLLQEIRISAEAVRVVQMRQDSIAFMRWILSCCRMHRADHDDEWPERLQDIANECRLPASAFVSPYLETPAASPSEDIERDGYYLYRPPPTTSGSEVVLCEREFRDGGAYFGFADGHVRWIEGEEATRLMAIMKG